MTLQPMNLPPMEIIRPPDHESWMRVYEPLVDLAARLANSPFVPDAMRGNPGDTFSVLLAGHGLGLSPIQSLQSIVLISRKPYISTEVILGLALRAGHQVQWLESTDKRATVRITRGDGRGTAEVTYTMGQAQAAGLTNKDNWRRMPAEMLRARAVRAALKMVAPDIALGLEAAEAGPVGYDPGSGSGSGSTVVQVAPAAIEAQPEPEPAPEPEPPLSEVEPEFARRAELVSRPQMRKIGALLGELETMQGARLGRDERRALIGNLIGLDTLESANDLTKEQASAVIEALQQHLTVDPDVEEVVAP